MPKVNNHKQFLELRSEHPFFIYEGFSVERSQTSLKIRYAFNLSDRYFFHPEIEFTDRNFYNFDTMGEAAIRNLAFHIGMVELISYWKTACPLQVIIRPYKLDALQVQWWKKLYFHGLGEFFYLNGIDTDITSFMEIISEGDPVKIADTKLSDKQVLVPVGGGKDSVVTLELIKGMKQKIFPFVVNPRAATDRTITTAGFDLSESMVVRRRLDKKLLELNEKGFLNGHTPFSSLLAFISVFAALASESRYVALSNESSANESTVPGSKVNHQYSKSFEFESDFADYVKRYVHPQVHYFSFLRPLNELQIAALFSGFPQHFTGFRSCNVGSKTDHWCGHCPKCLFTWIILSPFISQDRLESIFGKNLFQDRNLKPVFQELTGAVEVKPFECVGTPDEVTAALSQSLLSNAAPIPDLVKDSINFETNTGQFNELLSHWNNEHRLPEAFLTLLKNFWNENHA